MIHVCFYIDFTLDLRKRSTVLHEFNVDLTRITGAICYSFFVVKFIYSNRTALKNKNFSQ